MREDLRASLAGLTILFIPPVSTLLYPGRLLTYCVGMADSLLRMSWGCLARFSVWISAPHLHVESAWACCICGLAEVACVSACLICWALAQLSACECECCGLPQWVCASIIKISSCMRSCVTPPIASRGCLCFRLPDLLGIGTVECM